MPHAFFHSQNLPLSFLGIMLWGLIPWCGCGAPSPAPAVDYALYENRDFWTHSPNYGDISFDNTVRFSGNPVYRGTPPMEWPVNGFHFSDPVSGNQYVYVSLYPRGYWPAGNTKVLRSTDGGQSWEDLGICLDGDPEMFDGDGTRKGATLDISVVYANGKYHAAYGWAKPDNSDGGIAYAVADSPEGPFIRHPVPIHAESAGSIYFGKYRRIYASTILKRENDFLILTDTSTPRNAGGTWGFVAFTADDPEGEWRGPEFLLYPQDISRYLPSPVEFFPSFVHDGFVYAFGTSVALNRDYQALFRAPLKAAHESGAWELIREGSSWHSAPVENEASGIWGQTISGFVDKDGEFHILYPSKDTHDCGTINLARRDFSRPFHNEGIVSAPNSPSVVLLRRWYSSFSLDAELETGGRFSILFGHTGPEGPDDFGGAGRMMHPLMLSDCRELRIDPDGIEVVERDIRGREHIRSAGARPDNPSPALLALKLQCSGDSLYVFLDNDSVLRIGSPIKTGRLGLWVDKGNQLKIKRFSVTGSRTDGVNWLLPTQGTMDAGLLKNEVSGAGGDMFRYGFAGELRTDDAFMKWQFSGSSFGLTSPRTPQTGKVSVCLDGRRIKIIDLKASIPQISSVFFELSGLPEGKHVVSVHPIDGVLLNDGFFYR